MKIGKHVSIILLIVYISAFLFVTIKWKSEENKRIEIERDYNSIKFHRKHIVSEKKKDILAQKRIGGFMARAREDVYKSSGELKAQYNRAKRKGLNYNILIEGDHSKREVALTFDDGPHSSSTKKLLEILRKENIKATFFIVGKMAEKHPELLKAEYDEGHCIANHSFNHVNMTRIPEDEIEVEWIACSKVIKSITGKTPLFCRPPGGDFDGIVIRAAMKSGLITVLWTDDPGDYSNPGSYVIEQKVMDFIDNGGIILLHDGISQTLNILPQLIENLKKRGYRFITIEEMANERAGR